MITHERNFFTNWLFGAMPFSMPFEAPVRGGKHANGHKGAANSAFQKRQHRKQVAASRRQNRAQR